ncbi:hypothetical protein PR048_004657 [Dryococelus australis]|uniref:Uncharacterized protein n=1 Tax=Dryococelus australis TaxID=614101 RepID=A0ABQ9I613_9NEOP|nr:hypothetical protein PR048_004657 [Dryococelus australis]
MKRLESFEVWCYKQILKISWVNLFSNDEVFRRTGEHLTFWKTLQRRRDGMIGHTLRLNELPQATMEGNIDGKNHRGRGRLSKMSQIINDMKCSSYVELKRNAEKRHVWKIATNQSLD